MITSNSGYFTASIAWALSTIESSSLKAGTSTDTPGVSGLAKMSSCPAKLKRRIQRATSIDAIEISTR